MDTYHCWCQPGGITGIVVQAACFADRPNPALPSGKDGKESYLTTVNIHLACITLSPSQYIYLECN
jgi:hypothetical protein